MINEQKIRETYTYSITPNQDPITVLDWWLLFPREYRKNTASPGSQFIDMLWTPNLAVTHATLELYPSQSPVFAPTERSTDSILDDWHYQRDLNTRSGITVKFYEETRQVVNGGAPIKRLYGEQKLLNYGRIYTVDLLAFFFLHRAYFSDRIIKMSINYPIEIQEISDDVFIFCISLEGTVSWYEPDQRVQLL